MPKRPQAGGPLLTARAVASRLELHPRTVVRYARQGVIEATRTPAGYRFTQDAVDTYLAHVDDDQAHTNGQAAS